jgi:hypothetical protein
MARTPPPLPTVTLPGSGYTVEFRPIGPLRAAELDKLVRKSMPAPEPPTNIVTGLNGKPHEEPNPADPAYQEALAAHNDTVNKAVGEAIFNLIAQVITTPTDPDAVQQARDDFTAIGLALEGSDREVFLRHILVASEEDLSLLQAAVMRRSQPTEEAVQEKVSDFQGDVPRS